MYKSPHHNTTKETGQVLLDFTEQAEKQDDLVLKFLKHHKGKSFTPFQLHEFILCDAPITSLRRALSNLTKAEKIVMLQEKETEKYGRPNHKWVYTDEILTSG